MAAALGTPCTAAAASADANPAGSSVLVHSSQRRRRSGSNAHTNTPCSTITHAQGAAVGNILHLYAFRDLKPENMLLTSRDSSAQLKVIDFGTSEFCKPGQRLWKKFGTPYYVAPEVRRLQNPQCD